MWCYFTMAHIGNEMLNVLPFPGWLSTVIVP